MSDIRIHRDVPSIDGFLQVPPNKERNKNKGQRIDNTINLTPPLGTIVRLTGGSGRQRGSKTGAQEFFRLDGIRPDQWYGTDGVDPMDSLRTDED
jgi:hypothetical protein